MEEKKVRVNPSLTEDTHRKLERLSVACGMKKTHLASTIIEMVLNNETWVLGMQEKYNTHEAYRIAPVRAEGKLQY